MNLGFVSALQPDLSPDALPAFAQAESISCVETMCWPMGRSEREFAGVTHVAVTAFAKKQADAVKAGPAKPEAATFTREERPGGKNILQRFFA